MTFSCLSCVQSLQTIDQATSKPYKMLLTFDAPDLAQHQPALLLVPTLDQAVGGVGHQCCSAHQQQRRNGCQGQVEPPTPHQVLEWGGPQCVAWIQTNTCKYSAKCPAVIQLSVSVSSCQHHRQLHDTNTGEVLLPAILLCYLLTHTWLA